MNTEQELIELIQRTQAKARERLAELDDERRFLETFIGVNGTVPGTTSEPATPVPTVVGSTGRKQPNRKSPKRDSVYELLADGHKRSAKRVARELSLTEGSASSLLSHLYHDEMIEREGNRRHMRYFRELKKTKPATSAVQDMWDQPPAPEVAVEARMSPGVRGELIIELLKIHSELDVNQLTNLTGFDKPTVWTQVNRMTTRGLLERRGQRGEYRYSVKEAA